MTIEERIRYKIGREIINYQQRHLTHENFGGKTNLSVDEANLRITELIRSGKPFDVVRMGLSELQFLSVHTGATKMPEGFFYGLWIKNLMQSKEEADRFIRLYLDACEDADMIAVWYYSFAEDLLMKVHAAQADFCPATVVEPYYLEDPWIRACEGKKVLVVNPFAQTIVNQYRRRMEIYPNGLLPEFELKAIPSVWYNTREGNGQFESWFDALDYLKRSVEKVDFDIALLGCGPFGTPLTHYIKQMGKQAVYIGGALQILFG
ncbi:MAG: hypothetical protein IJV14_11285, partial [Lachnospiraceae bacterium]|nr:hypothetical protein [Lachnospiraceae bacterium]